MGSRPEFEQAARGLGRLMAQHGTELVYGGASIGLMGAVADAVLENGGRAIGVIPEHLADYEIAHSGLTRLEVVADMHTRKARMSELSNAFIALPGGVGTLEELFEVITWSGIGLHRKRCCLLNVAGFYNDLIHFLDTAVETGFIRSSVRELLLVAEQPAHALKLCEGMDQTS